LKATSQRAAIEEMVHRMYENGYLDSETGFVEDVIKREGFTTTGIGNNIAIPHGKSDTVKAPTIVFAKTDHLLEWHALDGQPVNIIFLMAVPESDAGDQHLRILAKLSSKLMNDDFVAAIKKADNVKDIVQLLSE
jgi:PTS system fructose-specific IIA component